MTLTDDKKKIVYIGLIIFCLVSTAAIIMMNMRKSAVPVEEPSASAPAPSVPTTQNTPTAAASGLAAQVKMLNDGNYPAPSVFPNQRQFDMSVFKSPAFVALTGQELPPVQPEDFGVDANPFRSLIKKDK